MSPESLSAAILGLTKGGKRMDNLNAVLAA